MTERFIGALQFTPETTTKDIESLETMFRQRWNMNLVVNLDEGCANLYKDESGFDDD